MTGTVTSSGRGGTAAAMTQNEQTAEEHSTLEQQSPGRLDHPAWCVVWYCGRNDQRRRWSTPKTPTWTYADVNCLDSRSIIYFFGNLTKFTKLQPFGTKFVPDEFITVSPCPPCAR